MNPRHTMISASRITGYTTRNENSSWTWAVSSNDRYPSVTDTSSQYRRSGTCTIARRPASADAEQKVGRRKPRWDVRLGVDVEEPHQIGRQTGDLSSVDVAIPDDDRIAHQEETDHRQQAAKNQRWSDSHTTHRTFFPPSPARPDTGQ